MESGLLEFVDKLGYVGIFLATLVESTFVPIPAEVTMVPAGMLAAQGKMDYWVALTSGSLGVVCGSMINYWIGIRFGRAMVLRYGKYVFIKSGFLVKTEIFFARYGRLAVFLGRLLPVVKHYIAFVAGLARMKFRPFVTYTAFGGVLWIWVLLQVGYMSERNSGSGSADKSLEFIAISITVITIIALVLRAKLMKH